MVGIKIETFEYIKLSGCTELVEVLSNPVCYNKPAFDIPIAIGTG